MILAGNRLRLAQGDELVIDGPQDPSLQTVPDQDIGPRLPRARILRDADRVVGVGHDLVIEVGTEDKLGVAPRPPHGQLDGGERRVLDDDAAALNRRDEVVLAVRLAPEHRGKQADQWFAADRRAVIKPSAVASNADVEIAAAVFAGLGMRLAGGCRRSYLPQEIGWI